LRVPQRGRSRFLGRPASRSCSSTEQEPGHRGESVSDRRPIACASSSFVRLLGSGAFIACGPTRARAWVRLGRPVAGARRRGRAREQAYVPRLDWRPTSSVCLDSGESACTGAKPCGVRAVGMLVEAPRGRGGRWSERNAVGLVEPASPAASRRVGRRRQAVWEEWHRAGRRPMRQLELCGQVALDLALSRLSAAPLRAGRSAPF
jgi:hypothetical protein